MGLGLQHSHSDLPGEVPGFRFQGLEFCFEVNYRHTHVRGRVVHPQIFLEGNLPPVNFGD